MIERLGGLAQLARAPALQAGGRRFDSDILHGEFRLQIIDYLKGGRFFKSLKKLKQDKAAEELVSHHCSSCRI